MVLIKEFRIPMPLTVDEYELGQLYSVAEVSREETQGDSGVEILKNEPYENEHGKGQYTYKIYHLGTRVPKFIQMLAPANALILIEEAWNGYPYCKTVLTNPFLGDRFNLTITSTHLPNRGTTENAHNLPPDVLKHRSVDVINIATDTVEEKDFSRESDPKTFRSEKTGRGLLKPNWVETTEPLMCCYKLVEIKFKVMGLESKVENFVAKFQRNMLLTFHRKLFCYIDRWYGMSIPEIREIEARAKEELDRKKLERQQHQSHTTQAQQHHQHQHQHHQKGATVP